MSTTTDIARKIASKLLRATHPQVPTVTYYVETKQATQTKDVIRICKTCYLPFDALIDCPRTNLPRLAFNITYYTTKFDEPFTLEYTFQKLEGQLSSKGHQQYKILHELISQQS
jgi:hypothetical protein